jgi:hypothetical protein
MKIKKINELYHLSDKQEETNQAWVRNKMGSIINFFSMTDDDTVSGYTDLVEDERKRALEMIEVIKNALESYKK